MIIAILHPRERAADFDSRFGALCAALARAGMRVEPAAYDDDNVRAVEAQLMAAEVVLVWHNPIEAGRTRTILDLMLRRVADRGVFVSAHPEAIVRMGTKDVLVETRDLPFGSDCQRVSSLQRLEAELPERLGRGPRVLKQPRGHSGIGVWRIEQLAADSFRLQHAQRGAAAETVTFRRVTECLAPYFADGGHMIDQAWQPRLADGMVRAYLVRERVAGFGHQAVNALYPASPGAPAPQPGPRLYSGPNDPRFQRLRRLLEDDWLALLVERVGLASEQLPLLWDADFMLGSGYDHYVLCEINVSSVSPYPESANAVLVEALQLMAARRV